VGWWEGLGRAMVMVEGVVVGEVGGCETLAETWQGSSSAWMVGAVCVWLLSLLVAVMR